MSGLTGTGLLHWDKALLQMAHLFSRCAYIEGYLGASLYDGIFQPFYGDPTSTINRHTTTAFRGRHILRVVMLSPWSVN
jgi:hypothetical protein